jgi:hypothetical protein
MSHFGDAVRDRGGCTATADRLGGGIGAAPAKRAQAWPAVHSLEGSAGSAAVPWICADTEGSDAALYWGPGPSNAPATNPATSSKQSVRAITTTNA